MRFFDILKRKQENNAQNQEEKREETENTEVEKLDMDTNSGEIDYAALLKQKQEEARRAKEELEAIRQEHANLLEQERRKNEQLRNISQSMDATAKKQLDDILNDYVTETSIDYDKINQPKAK